MKVKKFGRQAGFQKFNPSIRSLVILLTVFALFAAAASFVIPTRVAEAAGSINGRVYIDYNLNGAYDSSGAAPNYSIDIGVPNVTVTAYDSSGTLRGTTNSGSTGTYSLTATGTGPYRIEFTNLPSGMNPGTVGTNNGSTVRFVPNGTTNNVDLGIASQNSYCQNDPSLLTNCYVNGNSTTGEVLIDFPYSAGSAFGPTTMTPYQNPSTHSVVLDQTQIGPTWGLAYSRTSNRVYAASYFKKHTNFGPGGPGAVYEINPSTNSVTRTLTVPGATTNSHGTTNVCTGTHTVSECDNGNTGWDAVGKTALGGMAISQDESLLYVMNLQNRTLYEINRASGAAVRWQSMPGVPNVTGSVVNLSAASNLPPGSVTAANVRPFAVEFYNGKLYVGIIAAAETTPTTLTNLRAHVYEVEPSTLAMTRRFSVTLNYSRSDLLNAPGGTIPAAWNAWSPVFAVAGQLATGLGSDEVGFPQPLLAGIAFDEDGNMILGLRDRGGDQFGVFAPSNPAVNVTYVGESAGDTLMACGNQTTGWTIENNARCGILGNGPQGNGEGIGNGEYFYGDNWTDGTYSHDETSLGGLERIPGRPEIAATVFDPVNLVAGAFSAGARWLDADQGDAERAYNIFTTPLGSGTTFAKANGLGDVIAMCENAPLQVGNRVWNDANSNGIQDANEAVFANVAMQLWADTTNNGIPDTQIGTVNTDSGGNYLFGGPANSNLSSYACGSTTGTVDVQVSSSSDDAEQDATSNAVNTTSTDLDFLSNRGSAPNYGHVGMRFNNITVPTGATITSASIEFRANGTGVSGGSPSMTIKAQAADNALTFTTGNNNIGGRPTTGSVPWNPPAWGNNSVQQTPDLSSLVQAVVSRSGWSSGNSIALIVSGPISTAFREAESYNGSVALAPRLVINYSVANSCTYKINPNTAYEVRVANSNFNTGQPLQNFVPTTADADVTSNGDSRDSDGVVAGSMVVAPFTTGTYGTNDHTFDFGFRPAGGGSNYSVGNRVWYDTNNNGIIEPTERGIPGVSVSIFLDAGGDGVPDTPGSPIATLNTDANGYYRFDSLTANTYVIRINPSNFGNGALLEGYQNTAGINTADAESYGASSNAENGVNPVSSTSVLSNGLLSNPITLSGSSEPLGEADVPTSGTYAGQGTLDQYADMTVDVGFFGLSLSGTVWNDRGPGADNNDGELDAGETRLAGINVRLYNAAGVEIPVGPDGILGTADDANGGMSADSTGTYNFKCLAQGDYRVVVSPWNAPSSTPTETNPNLNGDNNDNGFPDNTGLFPGSIISGLVTLTPGFAGGAGNNVVTGTVGSTMDPTVDFGLLFAPTQVEMDKFEAFYKDNDVVLDWSTGGETDNLGFNVYRATQGGSVLLNSAPIAGSSMRTNIALQITGNDYRWVDKGAAPGSVYYLEDIDLNGTRTQHGPIYPQVKYSFQADAPSSMILTGLTDLEMQDSQREVLVAAADSDDIAGALDPNNDKQKEIAAMKGVKISVSKDDRYRVSFEELSAAGLDVGSDPRSWQLFADGREIPIRISNESKAERYIEFFGRRFESNFVNRQTYFLVQGNDYGARLEEVVEGPVDEDSSVRSYGVTAIRKDRGIYLSALLNGDKENWFGSAVTTSATTNQEINVSDPHQGGVDNAKLKVRLQGFTAVNHLVNISFNGRQLGTASYFDKENAEFEFEIPMSEVVNGPNSVQLRSVGAGSDISFVDEISLSYSREYIARNGKILFTVPAGRSAQITGFENPGIEVFELDGDGNPTNLVRVVERIHDGYGFLIGAASGDRHFAAFSNEYQPSNSASIELNLPSSWNRYEKNADLLIIAPMAFTKPASSLAELRNREGIRSVVVYVEDIYDEYGFGRKSDKAIKAFLEDAYRNWSKPPGYAILLGDSSFDMRNYYRQLDRDLIPTKLIDAKSLETANDAWLADFDNDGVEDISLGRLPAGTYAEAQQMVSKLERYRTQSGRKVKTGLLVADHTFQSYSDNLEVLMPRDVNAVKLNRASLADSELRPEILNQINGNAMSVTFTGHGSTNVWASNSVFNINDPDTLTNQQLSFFMLMTCLNGYMHNGNVDTIGEKLFKSPNGAIAVWASSGATYAADQISMSETMTRRLYDGNIRIGDLIRKAKQSTNDVDAKRTWQLIGDPTTIIK